MLRAFRYKLAPTTEQDATFWQFAGVCRFIYNLALEQRERYWHLAKANGLSINWFSQVNELTQLRAEYDWIAAVPRNCQDVALRQLDQAFTRFYVGRSRYPRYRQKGESESFAFKGREVSVRRINDKWSLVRLPKIGWVRFRDTRPRRGLQKTVTVCRDPSGWFVIFACEIEHEAPTNTLPAVGVDRGVANTLVLSTGEMLSLPTKLKELDRRHRRAQRVLARRQRGSNRRAKAKSRVAALAARRARIRRDWHHRASTSIARRFGAVMIEDLNVSGMTARGNGKRGLEPCGP